MTSQRRNQQFRSYIGLGYSNCITPAVIQRNVLENPGWYTPYTPYQAEIAQGRLEALLNFQTMVTDLTGMEVANASLLDEATAAAEAMTMLHRLQAKRIEKARGARGVLRRRLVLSADDRRAARAGRTAGDRAGAWRTASRLMLGADVFGALLQTPDEARAGPRLFGLRNARAAGRGPGRRRLRSPGTDAPAPSRRMGRGRRRRQLPAVRRAARVRRAACRVLRDPASYVRQTPGRIIGASVDAHGHTAYRMALQTREQHIRREKATSNICTAEALLANIAAFYAVYHGPDGLAAIARRIRSLAAGLERDLAAHGRQAAERRLFRHAAPCKSPTAQPSHASGRPPSARGSTSGTATTGRSTSRWTKQPTSVMSRASHACSAQAAADGAADSPEYPPALARTSAVSDASGLQRAPFGNADDAIILKSLERKDIGLDTSMIPLGSCTMKLNAAAAMMPITWSSFSKLHPFAPVEQAAGYQQILRELESALCTITGFAAVSLQPNSGAQGEFAGLMVIRAYHRDRGEPIATSCSFPRRRTARTRPVR